MRFSLSSHFQRVKETENLLALLSNRVSHFLSLPTWDFCCPASPTLETSGLRPHLLPLVTGISPLRVPPCVGLCGAHWSSVLGSPPLHSANTCQAPTRQEVTWTGTWSRESWGGGPRAPKLSHIVRQQDPSPRSPCQERWPIAHGGICFGSG